MEGKTEATKTEAINYGELLSVVQTEYDSKNPTLKMGTTGMCYSLDGSTLKVEEKKNDFGTSILINATLVGTNDSAFTDAIGKTVGLFLGGARMTLFNESLYRGNERGEHTVSRVDLLNLATVQLKNGKDYVPLSVQIVSSAYTTTATIGGVN